jgi:chromatin segregation and condensation protein Rec8/ScpA/Scc1 (kleisin family)
VMFEMEKGPRVRLPSETPAEKPKYRSRWMRRKQTTTIARQTTATDPETLAIKMESMNLEAIAKIAKKREEELQAEILSGSLRQERLKKQLEECSRNRRQASATATNVDGGTSCRGATALRCLAEADDDNTDDWQAELLHDVDEDTFEKLDNIAADIDEMATRERWLFCRSCKAWHMVP